MQDLFRETIQTRINDLQCEIDILEEKVRNITDWQKKHIKDDIRSKKEVIKINERWLYRLNGGLIQ